MTQWRDWALAGKLPRCVFDSNVLLGLRTAVLGWIFVVFVDLFNI